MEILSEITIEINYALRCIDFGFCDLFILSNSRIVVIFAISKQTRPSTNQPNDTPVQASETASEQTNLQLFVQYRVAHYAVYLHHTIKRKI